MNTKQVTLLITVLVISSIMAFKFYTPINTHLVKSLSSQVTDPKISKEVKLPYELSLYQKTQVEGNEAWCDDYEVLKNITQDLEKVELGIRESFSLLINNMDISLFAKEQLIIESNIPVENFRKSTLWHKDIQYTTLMAVNGKPEPITGLLRDKFNRYVRTKDYNKILILIKSEKFNINSIIGGKSILLSIIESTPNISLSYLEQLLHAGLIPNFSDLVALVKNKATFNVIERIAADLKEPLDQVWYEYFRENTLSMIAAENLNDELFDLWLSLGVPLRASKFDYSAIDVIGIPHNEYELTQAINIFIKIANQYIPPLEMTTLIRIKKWLPKEIQDEYPFYFKNKQDYELRKNLNALLSKDEIEKVNKMTINLSEIDREIEKNNLILQTCTIKNRIKNNIIQADSGTIVKNSLEELLLLEPEMQKYLLDLNSSIVDKNWKKYLIIHEELLLSYQEPSFSKVAIMQLIQADAPFKIIEKLLQDGAVLPDATIFLLILKNNDMLIEKLKPYGLQFDIKDANDLSPYLFAIEQNASKEMLNIINNLQ